MPRVIVWSGDEATLRLERSTEPVAFPVPRRLWLRYRLVAWLWGRLQRYLGDVWDEAVEFADRERASAWREYAGFTEEGEALVSLERHADGSLAVVLASGEERTYPSGTWEIYDRPPGRLPLVRRKPEAAPQEEVRHP
jgi:hypothetical protein